MKISTVKFSFLQLFPLGLLLTTVGMPGYASELENLDSDMQAKRAIIAQLKGLTLEQLIEVETFNPKGNLAARKFQQLTETAAALFVITQEDIRRAGITRLAEALRMVPGLQVARISPHQWAISARGLNEYYASKLLVMIDGRTVYTPLRSEVFWDVQDILIEDVERIEVIRGPGASLWGANAVNGIINIITKAAKDTPGNLVTTQVGSGEEQGVVEMQHGGSLLNDGGHYRVYGKFYQQDGFPNAQGVAQNNHWQMRRGGGRLDGDASNRDALTLQGDIYEGIAKQPTIIPMPPVPPLVEAQTDVKGFNILSRWQHHLDNGDFLLQSYYDRTYRKELFSEEHREIFDLDFQHRWQVNGQHEFMWGLGYRYTQDKLDGFYIISYQPPRRHDQLFSAFVQSEWLLQPALRLTIGSKFEHNNYTGFEFQPTTRLLWHFAEKQSVWAAVSRAVRTPSRTDEDMVLNLTVPNFQMVIQGNADLKSESLLAYELGYRLNLPN
jgi:iron complex outermembrane receptor protein